MSKSDTSPTSSGATGPTRLGALPSVIGREPGKPESAPLIKPEELARVRQRLMDQAEDPAQVTVSLWESLAARRQLSLGPRTSSGSYLMEVGDNPDFDGARRDCEMACIPLDIETLAKELTRLRLKSAATKMPDDDIQALIVVYVEELTRYPADVVLYVLRSWPKSSRFFPSWHELEGRLTKLAGRRMATRDSIDAVERSWRKTA